MKWSLCRLEIVACKTLFTESRGDQNLDIRFAPRVEEAYILDVEVAEELKQKVSRNC